MRGRGLKRYFRAQIVRHRLSPPVRGRGLKLLDDVAPRAPRLSPPVRGRGLKLSLVRAETDVLVVAPRAGARIETCWCCGTRAATRRSPPVRGRGLKRFMDSRTMQNNRRPPCGGAD